MPKQSAPQELAKIAPKLVDVTNNVLFAHLGVALENGLSVPRSVPFADELPRTPSGKMLRRLLVDRYRGLSR
jgi:acyl-CoA synthetase (AMP-forming)/AMP-acid ligase II